MTEPRRPVRRGRGRQAAAPQSDVSGEVNPYRDDADAGSVTGTATAPQAEAPTPPPPPVSRAAESEPAAESAPSPRPEPMETFSFGEDRDAEPASDGGEGSVAGQNGVREGRPGRGPRRGRGRGGHQGGPRPDGRPQGGEPRGDQREPQQRNDARPFDRSDRGPQQFDRGGRPDRGDRHGRRRNRQRNRGRDVRDGRDGQPQQGQQSFERQPVVAVADTAATGWLGLGRDGGYVRQAANSYLPSPSDPFVPMSIVRQYGLRAGDKVEVMAGRDQRGRLCVAEVTRVNDDDPQNALKRPDFQALMATYPDRKLKLETGRPAKAGPEVTRRVVDLVAPIGYGQRALIVAPARSGKTMLLQAIMEGVAINHPEAHLLVLLVDERPEEVSDMVACGYGEVVASSFDMPADRHRDVVEMVMERARRLVELGKDVVIVLDSITRMARAFNTIERGIGRTLSGGLDATAMAKPKAFFGSARAVAPSHGGGSLTIIGTALVETGSRMDDVIFEEFKGTGNSEIKLDRSLSERRIYPAIDIPASGTRREDKLFRPDQLDAIYVLRRGLQQMPPAAAMEWLIKRIGVTRNNDALLDGLKDA
jgi:transcription termination factor Rho